MTEKEFEIIETIDAGNLVKKHHGKLLRQSEEDMSILYILNSGQVLLFPASGDKVLLFKAEKDVNRILAKYGKIPIEEPYNPFKAFEENIMRLPKSESFFLSQFSSLTHENISLQSYDRNLFLQISERLTKLITENKGNEDPSFWGFIYISTGIFIGSQIKIKIGGEWVIKKEYGVNPYWVPNIEFDNKLSIIWPSIWKGLEDKKLDLRLCLNSACLRYQLVPFKGIRLPFDKYEFKIGDQPDL